MSSTRTFFLISFFYLLI